MRTLLGVVVCALAMVPSQALAQEEGRIGVTMGYPSAVGVLWHVTEDVAIRPEFTFSWSSSESGFGESDGFSLGTGISALFYTSRSDSLATYFSPRYSFARTNTQRTFEGDEFIEPEIETTARGHAFSGSFGAQYFLGSRFSMFGELGLTYSRSKASTDLNDDESKSSSFGLGSNIGVVLYF